MSSKGFKIHSVQYNFIMNLILKMSAFVFPLISFPYVSRILQASGNGKVAFAAAVINYFVLLASLGIPSYGVKACAQVRDNRDELSKTVQELLAINFVCLIISYIMFAILLILIPEFREEKILLWISSASIILSAAGVEWFYQAIEQYDYITVRNIGFKLLSIILMFLFVKKPEDYIVYGGITVIGSYGSNVLNVLRLPKYISLKKKSQYTIKRHLAPICSLFLYNAATTIYTNMDTVMLGMMVGDEQVGYYNASVKIKGILSSFVTAMAAVLLPRASYYLSKEDNDKFIKLIQKTFQFVLLSAIPLAAFFVFVSKPTILVLAGEDYLPSVIPMQIITPAIVFIGIGSITAWQMLIPLGREKYTVIGAITGGIVDLLINWMLIPKWGASGAAFGTLIAEISVVGVHFLALRDKLIKVSVKNELIKILAAVIVASIVYVAVDKMLNVNNLILELGILAVCFFSMYYLMLIIMKESIAKEYTEGAINKIKVLFEKQRNK